MPELYDQDQDTHSLDPRLGRLLVHTLFEGVAMIGSCNLMEPARDLTLSEYMEPIFAGEEDGLVMLYGEPQIGYAGPEEFAPEDLGIGLDEIKENIDLKDFQEIVDSLDFPSIPGPQEDESQEDYLQRIFRSNAAMMPVARPEWLREAEGPDHRLFTSEPADPYWVAQHVFDGDVFYLYVKAPDHEIATLRAYQRLDDIYGPEGYVLDFVYRDED